MELKADCSRTMELEAVCSGFDKIKRNMLLFLILFQILSTLSNNVANDVLVSALVSENHTVYSATNDGHLILWNSDTQRKTSFKGHFLAITALAHDATYLYSSSIDKSIRMWRKAFLDPFDIRKALARTFRGHQAAVRSLCIQNNSLYSGSSDKTIRKWNPRNGSVIRQYGPFKSEIYSIVISGQFLFAGLSDATVIQIDSNNGSVIAIYQGHTRTVSTINVMGNFLYSGSWDKSAKMWDTASGRWDPSTKMRIVTNSDVIVNFTGGHTDSINAIHATDQFLFTGGTDQTIIQSNLFGKIVAIYDNSHAVMAFLASNTELLAVSKSCRLKKWIISTSSNNAPVINLETINLELSEPITLISTEERIAVKALANVDFSSDYILSFHLNLTGTVTWWASTFTSDVVTITFPSNSRWFKVYYQTNVSQPWQDCPSIPDNGAYNKITLIAKGNTFYVFLNSTIARTWSIPAGTTRKKGPSLVTLGYLNNDNGQLPGFIKDLIIQPYSDSVVIPGFVIV